MSGETWITTKASNPLTMLRRLITRAWQPIIRTHPLVGMLQSYLTQDAEAPCENADHRSKINYDLNKVLEGGLEESIQTMLTLDQQERLRELMAPDE